MPNKEWSKLTGLQLGRYAEYYAKMEFTSYGFEVYTSEVDDHGIDFVVKNKAGRFQEIQVKSVCKTNYVFMKKKNWNINNPDLYLALLIFKEGYLPDFYIIPAIDWKMPNTLLRDKNFENCKSEPEYGLNLSLKNMLILEKYKIENMI